MDTPNPDPVASSMSQAGADFSAAFNPSAGGSSLLPLLLLGALVGVGLSL